MTADIPGESEADEGDETARADGRDQEDETGQTDRSGEPDWSDEPGSLEGVLREYFVVYLKGVAMGAADTLPGVSGGTIALITGIYTRLISALTALDPRVLGLVPRLHTASVRREFLAELRRMDVHFLAALGLGVVTVVVLLSRVAHAALTSFEAETAAFFFGLIAVSAIVLYREVSLETVPRAMAALAGFVIAFLLAGASASGGAVSGPPPLPLVFGIAAVAISAMVLPGVSGAFVLYLIGQYEYLTGVLKAFVDHVIALPSRGLTPALVDSGMVVLTFVTGAVVGVFSVAYAIRWALDRAHAATLAFLVSLMVGSLRLPVETVHGSISAWTLPTATGVAAAFLVGGVAIFLLDRYTADLEYGPDH